MNVIDWFCRSNEIRLQLEGSRDRLYRVAYSWCHDVDLADDLVQLTMIKAYRNNRQLRDAKAINTWLFQILTNCWRDHLRSQKETVSYEDAFHHHEDTPEKLHESLETVSRVQDAVEDLPLGQREVVTLVVLEGFTYAEVADVLDIPTGTVMSRLCRARQTLTEKLRETKSSSKNINPALRRVK